MVRKKRQGEKKGGVSYIELFQGKVGLLPVQEKQKE